MSNKSLTDNVISLVGSLSVLIFSIVIPYTIGYFTFFDVRYMSFFTPSEFAIFSAMPLLAITMAVVSYIMLPFLVPIIEKPISKALTWLHPSQKSSPLSNMLTPKFVYKMIAAVFPLYFIHTFISASLPIIIFWASLCAVVTIFAISQLYTIDRILLYSLLFLSFESLVFSWGYVLAEALYLEKRPIVLQTKEQVYRGFMAFVGTESILAFDDADQMFFLKADGSAKISLGNVRQPVPNRCVDALIVKRIREIFNGECIRAVAQER